MRIKRIAGTEQLHVLPTAFNSLDYMLGISPGIQEHGDNGDNFIPHTNQNQDIVVLKQTE